jgi:hypothetical protein
MNLPPATKKLLLQLNPPSPGSLHCSKRARPPPSAEILPVANLWYQPPAHIYPKPENSTVFNTATDPVEPTLETLDLHSTENSVPNILATPLPHSIDCEGTEGPKNFSGIPADTSETDLRIQGGTASCQPKTGEAAAMKTAAQSTAPTTQPKRRKRGKTDMLTPEDPYGKNPHFLKK